MWNTFDFEDGDLIEFYNDGNNIVMKLEHVEAKDQELVNGTLIFVNVKKLMIEEASSDEVSMYYKKGSILCMEKQANSILIVVEWTNYKTHEFKTIAYNITAEKVNWNYQKTGFHYGDDLYNGTKTR